MSDEEGRQREEEYRRAKPAEKDGLEAITVGNFTP
jgi:hypothetical protein